MQLQICRWDVDVPHWYRMWETDLPLRKDVGDRPTSRQDVGDRPTSIQDVGDRPIDTGFGRQTHWYRMGETDPLIQDERERPAGTGWKRQTHWYRMGETDPLIPEGVTDPLMQDLEDRPTGTACRRHIHWYRMGETDPLIQEAEDTPLIQDGGDRPTDTGCRRQTQWYRMEETDPLIQDGGDRPTLIQDVEDWLLPLKIVGQRTISLDVAALVSRPWWHQWNVTIHICSSSWSQSITPLSVVAERFWQPPTCFLTQFTWQLLFTILTAAIINPQRLSGTGRSVGLLRHFLNVLLCLLDHLWWSCQLRFRCLLWAIGAGYRHWNGNRLTGGKAVAMLDDFVASTKVRPDGTCEVGVGLMTGMFLGAWHCVTAGMRREGLQTAQLRVKHNNQQQNKAPKDHQRNLENHQKTWQSLGKSSKNLTVIWKIIKKPDSHFKKSSENLTVTWKIITGHDSHLGIIKKHDNHLKNHQKTWQSL